jgi:hypothetical protein
MQRLILLALLLSTLPAAAQAPTDGIDRNLLERAQRLREFGVTLEDGPLPSAPAPGLEKAMPITLMPPGVDPAADRRRPSPTPSAPAVPTRRDASELQQLHADQQRRQLHLQLETRELPEAARRPALDTQQMNFERESRAQELGAEIMRRSSEATGRR